jgi:hypothetical protein
MDQQVRVSLVFRRSGQRLYVNIPYHLLQAAQCGSFDLIDGPEIHRLMLGGPSIELSHPQ